MDIPWWAWTAIGLGAVLAVGTYVKNWLGGPAPAPPGGTGASVGLGFYLKLAISMAVLVVVFLLVDKIARWYSSPSFSSSFIAKGEFDRRVAEETNRRVAAALAKPKVYTFSADNTWSKSIEGGMTKCIHWQRQDSVAFEVMFTDTKDSLVAFFPKTLDRNTEVEITNKNHEVVHRVKADRNGSFPMPKLEAVAFRVVGARSGSFRVEVTER